MERYDGSLLLLPGSCNLPEPQPARVPSRHAEQGLAQLQELCGACVRARAREEVERACAR